MRTDPTAYRIVEMLACVLWFLLATASCGESRLTAREATNAIQREPGASDLTVEITAISQARSSPEAIAIGHIAGSEHRFKLRLYDTGWKWESVESAVGVIPSSQVVAEIAERDRQKRAMAWANQQRPGYVATSEMFDDIASNLSRKPSDMLGLSSWVERNNWLLRLARSSSNPEPEKSARIRKLEGTLDGWDRQIAIDFDAERRSAIYASGGADTAFKTADDVVCLFTGRLHWDDFYKASMWDYIPRCTVPEGLTESFLKWVERKGGSVEKSVVIR